MKLKKISQRVELDTMAFTRSGLRRVIYVSKPNRPSSLVDGTQNIHTIVRCLCSNIVDMCTSITMAQVYVIIQVVVG